MKKSLLALAVLGAFAGVAQAQTSVTIYGSFDGGVRYQSDQDVNGRSKTTMSSTGTYNSNRLGFKGVEDLGGGLNAHFTLESAFNTGNGAADANRFFGRSAFVGLGGQWGSIDLGRQYTVAFKTVGAYDPFNYKYTGIIPTALASISAGTRNDNDIQYTGTFGPLTARAEYALGERVGGGSGGSAAAVGATFATGPFSVGAAYTKRKPTVDAVAAVGAAPAIAGQDQDNRHYTVGGAFTFGPGRIAAGYAREEQDRVAGGETTQKNAWVGGSYDITPALGLTAAYYHTKADGFGVGANNSGKRGLFIVGATYALSKRTNFYADVDYTKYKDGLASASTGVANTAGLNGSSGSQLGLASAPGQDKQVGVSVGINHLF
ncbi:porin [Noviherbaspirillum suwonense]|uniref:Outer membrane protein (Porin) n=1 Tax=Noviherbaspirillum suwonense TaxID=1224511 RepID=A0ABY1QFE1_9BURK|nr:porin [Noviherbaspirillum suwonense]SMP69113.1 Outer membrane protein (porin) [Noviherbaspirillum suwonense]